MIGKNGNSMVEEGTAWDDGDISNDHLVKKGDRVTWFRMGMTWEEKVKAWQPWRNSLIVKMVGHPIGYHYLWRQIQVMWRIAKEPLLADLAMISS